MRVSLNIINPERKILWYNYHESIRSTVISKISSIAPEIAIEFHEKKNMIYNFSNIIGDTRNRHGIGITFSRAKVYFSSPDEIFIKTLIQGVMKDQMFELINPEKKEKLKLVVGGVKFESSIPYSEKVKLKTLSPIISMRPEGRYQKYLTPKKEPEEWKDSLIYGIRRKFQTFYGKEPEKLDLNFNLDELNLEYVHIKGRGYMGVEGKLEVTADHNTLEFISDIGFGQKSRFGYGFMVDVNA